MTKIFYGPSAIITPELEAKAGTSGELGALDSFCLEPAPYFNIQTNYNYAGDNIIGYNYTFNLEGTIVPTGIDGGYYRSMEKNVEFLEKNKRILNYFGGTFYVTDDEYNTLLKAKGGRLENINYNNSTNNWAGSIPYTATLQFQDMVMGNHSLDCSDSLIDNNSIITNLVDINKYKIKSFEDSWNFDFSDDIYTDIVTLDDGTTELITDNLSFQITYNIQAAGTNFFIEAEDGTETLVPTWESAKLFCQDRLYRQVTSLVSGVLNLTADINCDSNTQQSNLFPLPANSGAFFTNSGRFNVYNETINCASSESDGSFSAQYTALVKRGNSLAKHTFQKTIQDDRPVTPIAPRRIIEIQGNIEGLALGGLVYTPTSSFRLPQTGYLVIAGSPTFSNGPKYDNAINFGSFYFNTGETDLSDAYKALLNITVAALIDTDAVDCAPLSDTPEAASFSIEKNPFDGTINYTASYNDSKVVGGNYSNITIDVQRQTPVVASFTIPNGADVTDRNPNGIGTVIQAIGTYTGNIMNISITGRDSKLCCQTPASISAYLNNSNTDFVIPNDITLPSSSDSILTEKSKNVNLTTGEYTIKLTYNLCTDGCFI